VNLTLSPPVKILALVLVLAGVALVASLSLLGKSAPTVPAGERHGSAERRTTRTTPAVTTPAKAAAAKAAVARAAAAKPRAKATTPAVKPTVKAHAKPAVKAHAKPKPQLVSRGNLVYSTLPPALQWSLSQHKVVVVSIYNPNSDVDAIAVAEAHAGAVKAGAGFLLVSVLDNKTAGILTALLPGGGLLPDPGVLVYRSPGDLALRLDGFHDRDAVAQAATNAGVGETDPTQATRGTVPAAATAAAPATAPAVTP
jgi:hypothetical protein